MSNRAIYLGDHELSGLPAEVSGSLVMLNGEKHYVIQNVHQMPDFFITVVSDSDHWMFASSNGSLSAGRKDRDNALFPYYTDDKIHDYGGKTGSRSCFRITRDHKTQLWEPFTLDAERFYQISRNLYKSIYGNSLVYEEINHSLGLTFRYSWHNSQRFGFVRKASLMNAGNGAVSAEMLDGLLNILPSGLEYAFQNEYSNLADAYKTSERPGESSLALFSLSAIPVDKAEPSEALITTTVWSWGLGENPDILLSELQWDAFARGEAVKPEKRVHARRGAYLVHATVELKARQNREWIMAADINQSAADVVNIQHFLASKADLSDEVPGDIQLGTRNLKRLLALSDGFQLTASELDCARHYSNTLFNIMRGGVFSIGYQIEKHDFAACLQRANRQVYQRNLSWLEKLPSLLSYADFIHRADATDDQALIRLAREYLPLSFSRRHGDPSRPWNQFSIKARQPDTQIPYHYEGNWRDIFQNWEALAYSFPEYTESMLFRFLNASTADGYNPYRIMREGIDWEAPDPDDPWAYIGYWGDHQIIYLQKLLELSEKFFPGRLKSLLQKELFVYALIPYRIKPLEQIIENSKDTVVFDHALNAAIKIRAEELGSDACLLSEGQSGQVYRVNLMEKILVSLLSKLSNFIPEAGIWLNTQRPEWNDANNALVGNGTSMVTVYHLRRFLQFWKELLEGLEDENIPVSVEVAEMFEAMHACLVKYEKQLRSPFSDADRLQFALEMGSAHSQYRQKIYEASFSSEKKELSLAAISQFMGLCLVFTDHSIRAAMREDGMYHAYNLISFRDGGIRVRHLYEMLEGQAAVLSAGFLTARESLQLLTALRRSRMYREDQQSYMLYPERVLPGFVQKNTVPEEAVKSSALLRQLLAENNYAIIQPDVTGGYHFNPAFRNAAMLNSALDKLALHTSAKWVEKERRMLLDMYESVFDHQSFTGRSGTFYGYEGLGSIYWHMVSKLLLSVQETYFRALDQETDSELLHQLKEHYYEIKAGIGLYKNPLHYGAFPTDAHSHTPAGSGARQPGLTGQVKEDLIARLGELSLRIHKGQLVFEPSLLDPSELLNEPGLFEMPGIEQQSLSLSVDKGRFVFSFCQLPIVVNRADNDAIRVLYSDGSREEMTGRTLPVSISRLIFSRSGTISHLEVSLRMPEALSKSS